MRNCAFSVENLFSPARPPTDAANMPLFLVSSFSSKTGRFIGEMSVLRADYPRFACLS